MDTKEVIADMLKERVGTSILDSGGTPNYDSEGNYIGSSHGYGRNFEKNQSRQFEDEPMKILRIDKYGIEYTRNIYHFLTESLEYEQELTESLFAFDEQLEDKYLNWWEVIKQWLEQKGYAPGLTDNIYNHQNNLSQVFWYCLFSTNHESGAYTPDIYECEYVILMIHQGADVRGGYTAPRIFSWEDSFLMTSDGYIQCEFEDRHSWYTDDSYNWYFDNYDEPRLNELELVHIHEYHESEEYQKSVEKMIIVPEGQDSFIPGYNPKVINPVKYPKGVILFDEDSIGYCPICSQNGQLNKLV